MAFFLLFRVLGRREGGTNKGSHLIIKENRQPDWERKSANLILVGHQQKTGQDVKAVVAFGWFGGEKCPKRHLAIFDVESG